MRHARGVTLTELLVGLVVLGIVVAVAIPVLRSYAIDVNRSDARRDLAALSARLQRCFARSGDYRIDAAGSTRPCVELPAANTEGTYEVAFAPGHPLRDGFRLVASPLAAQARDADCGALTLDNKGAQGITGSGSAQDCWRESAD